jgi:hypothetical protein
MAIALAALAVTVLPTTAQSALDASQATEFLGSWVISLNTEYGAFTIELNLEDQGGKVAATVRSVDMGVTEEVTDVTRTDDRLVLKYESEAQGQVFPVQLDLTREGEGMRVRIDAADGQFSALGSATRADGLD